MDAEQVIVSIANHLDLSSAEILADDDLLARFLEFVNDAIDDLTRHGDWEFLRTNGDVLTEVAVETVAMPEDFSRLIVDSNPYIAVNPVRVLRAIGHGEMARRALSGQGEPRLYRLLSSEIDLEEGTAAGWTMEFYPTPDAVYSIIVPYRRRIPTLTAATDQIAIPGDFDGLLKLGARCEAEEGWERMAQSSLRPKYEAAKARAWAELNSPIRDQRIGRLRPWRGAGVRGLCSGFSDDDQYVQVNEPGS